MSLWQVISLTVRDLSQASASGNGSAILVRNSACQRGSSEGSGRRYWKMSPKVARIWSRPWGQASGATGAGEFVGEFVDKFVDNGSSVIIERFQLGRRFGL